MKSMTGFGKAVGELPDKKITVEIKSLNSRQFDLSLRTPGVYREKESEIRAELSKQAERGKIDFSIYSEYLGEENPVRINQTLAKSYHRELKKLAAELKEKPDELLSLIIKMPDILKADRQELDEREWKTVRKLIDLAIRDFQKFRDEEGKVLLKEFNKRLSNISDLLAETVKLDNARIPSLRDRIQKGLNELKEKIDQNRFEQELIYYIEKLDITEEKLRLKTHLDYFLRTMTEPSSGRKLGFITQEIGREINTLGSKANDAGIQKLVVQMKDELEKIKEQLLNVL